MNFVDMGFTGDLFIVAKIAEAFRKRKESSRRFESYTRTHTGLSLQVSPVKSILAIEKRECCEVVDYDDMACSFEQFQVLGNL